MHARTARLTGRAAMLPRGTESGGDAVPSTGVESTSTTVWPTEARSTASKAAWGPVYCEAAGSTSTVGTTGCPAIPVVRPTI